MQKYIKIAHEARKKTPGEWIGCEARMNGCTNTAVEFHHIRGRGGALLNDPNNLIAVCRECHRSIHGCNTEEVRELLEKIVKKHIM